MKLNDYKKKNFNKTRICRICRIPQISLYLNYIQYLYNLSRIFNKSVFI